jgi:hypothetical protein
LEKDIPGMQILKGSKRSFLISEKADLKQKSVQRDKEGHYILIAGTIQQEDITILNIYALNTSVPKFIEQTLLSLMNR